MIKTVGLLKRRKGMSVEDFRAYYESTHRVIGERVLAGYSCKYMRRFLNPSSDSQAATFGAEGDFDVVLEIWYPDDATAEACQKHLATFDIAAEILADELKLFDRDKNRFFTVTESVSDMPT